MDAAILTRREFWEDPRPVALDGEVPDVEGLEGHVLFRSSGTTGEPKWVALSKEALLVSAAAVNRHLEVDVGAVWGLALAGASRGGLWGGGADV